MLLFAVGVADASAGLITLGGTPAAFQTPPPPGDPTAPNDVIPGLWGYLDADLYLTGTPGTAYLVTFTLVGSESGWTNQLQETQGNTTITEHADNSTVGDSISYIHVPLGASELLKFQFNTIAGVNPLPAALVNGNNQGKAAARSFFTSFCIDTTVLPGQQKNLACNTSGNAQDGDIAWLGLDDSGAGPNDNHDDWVGYVKVTPVTVPDGGSALALLGAALTGLGMLRRRLS